MCNDGSGDYVRVNGDLCVGCGECLEACTHGARVGLDDAEAFFADRARGRRMIAVVAPATASNLGGDYLRFNGWLASLGIEAIFDVSFGAELTVRSYLEYKKTANPRCIIAQPCPTLVTFVEIYRPSLIPLLAPADSPMAHTMRMVRRFFPAYADCAIAVISPCYSKRREFDEIGLGDYNVTFKSLDAHMKERGIDISAFPPRDFDGPKAERAVLFPTPGGLTRTVERQLPGASEITKRIEGHPGVFHYLAHLEETMRQGEAPIHQLVDCLNCEMGCNGGPGTRNRGRHQDSVESGVERRSLEAQKAYKPRGGFRLRERTARRVSRLVDRYWEAGLYDRAYVDRSQTFRDMVRKPSKEDIASIHLRTHKETERDILNCGACGYKSCEQMAVAIINRLNRPENCRHYMSVEVALLNGKHRQELGDAVKTVASNSAERLGANMDRIGALAGSSAVMASRVVESSTSIEQMVSSVQAIDKALRDNESTVAALMEASSRGKESIAGIASLVAEVSRQSDGLVQASAVIQQIADKTNLLAMNAAIEATHAGSFGKGFAVVAGEIRKLAENAAAQTTSISTVLTRIKELIDKTAGSSTGAQAGFERIVELTERVRNEGRSIQQAIDEQSAGGRQVLAALSEINAITAKVRDEAGGLQASSREVIDEISRLKEMGTASAREAAAVGTR